MRKPMQVVINISDDLHEWINDPNKCLGDYGIGDFIDLIKNATPLPKGHKVIDAYALQEYLALVPMEDRTYREAVEIIDRFPTIIEADKE